ncbi:hypothetical protein ABIF50_007867 [Bradyrhizobium diazoefficiens]
MTRGGRDCRVDGSTLQIASCRPNRDRSFRFSDGASWQRGQALTLNWLDSSWLGRCAADACNRCRRSQFKVHISAHRLRFQCQDGHRQRILWWRLIPTGSSCPARHATAMERTATGWRGRDLDECAGGVRLGHYSRPLPTLWQTSTGELLQPVRNSHTAGLSGETSVVFEIAAPIDGPNLPADGNLSPCRARRSGCPVAGRELLMLFSLNRQATFGIDAVLCVAYDAGERYPGLASSPAASMPVMAQASSLSEVSPETPTAPSSVAPSMISTPPGTGTSAPLAIAFTASMK